jgi:hypothetical protein
MLVNYALLFLIVLFATLGKASHPRNADAASSGKVRLSAEVLSTRYCNNYKGVRSLFLKLKLRLVNDERAPVEADIPLSGVNIVSHTLADAAAGKHEFEMHAPESLATPSTSATAAVKKIVQPGQSVESVTDNVQHFVWAGQDNTDMRALKPGRHYLQIQIDVFPPNAKLAELISVVRRVTSEPIPIDIEENPALAPRCSELFKNANQNNVKHKKPEK